MSISNVYGVAASGLRFQADRLQESAHNVANVQTEGFSARTVVGEEQENGGVSGELVETGDPGPIVLEDGEEVILSNTELENEAVTQITAKRAYTANLKTLETAQEMDEELMDLVD